MKNKKTARTETDFLGQISVPTNAYYGINTARAMENFKISGLTSPKVFLQALGLTKLAAVQTNNALGLIKNKEKTAIETACNEFIKGKFNDQFVLDVFQAGAGTSHNMNANEIIANRANELLGGKKGEYKFVHPNNHVNMAQSTNDVIPTVTRIAVLMSLPGLLEEIKNLEKSIEKKKTAYSKIIKVGRTHLMDAVPITLWQEFDSYRQAIKKSREFIEERAKDLKILGIGGTAVGTGINSDPNFKKLVVKNLSKLVSTFTKVAFKSAENLTEIANNMNSFMNFSATLKSLSTNLLNFCLDLKLMNSGPKTGFGEITLPATQPGSSIMPGKVNPSVPECVEMVCFQVLGNDRTIELAAQRSNFELNVMCPIIMYNILESIEILKNAIHTLRTLCVDGIKVNTDSINKSFQKSLATATALAPYIGYEMTADIVKSALKKNISVKEELLGRKMFSSKKIEEMLSHIGPQKIKKA